MSCSSASYDKTKRPPRTQRMTEKDQVYLWKTVRDNPNLFCWLPASLKGSEPGDITVEEASIQDIPPVPESRGGTSLEEMIEHAEKISDKILRRKFEDGSDLASSDYPGKYKLVKKFLTTRKVILYGGAAINMYMPKGHKIYTRTAIPDYDVYSSDPWTDATALADYMYDNGYQFSEARAGIHHGTYKVFVNTWPVADISYLNPEIMDVLKTRKIEGFNVIPVSEVQSAMYRQLSVLNQSHRWEKVYERQKAFSEHVNPLGNKKIKCNKTFDRTQIPQSVRDVIAVCNKICVKKKIVAGGDIAYNTYVSIGGGTSMIPVSSLRYFSANPEDDSDEIFTSLLASGIPKDSLNISTTYSPLRPINSTAYEIDYLEDGDVYTVLSLVTLDTCIAYKYILNKYVVSIDFLKYELYLDLAYKNLKHGSKCEIKYITYLQNRYYDRKGKTEFDNTPFQRLVSNCVGPLRNELKEELMNRMVDKLENSGAVKVVKPKKDTVVLKNVKGATVRVYPKEPIPKECFDKPEDECNYPCYWNTKNKRCFGQQQGVYVAGTKAMRPLDVEDEDYEGQDRYPEYRV
jgi:hypothetical protein